MQKASLIFTALAPLLLWTAVRRWPTDHLGTVIRRVLAIGLLLFYVGDLWTKIAAGGTTLGDALPMQLCDWVLFAVAGALWWRWQLGFELGYFWGLAGTAQALFTPAIDADVPWWRLFGFFFSHAWIVVSVLHLLIAERCRPWPRSLVRVLACSGIYVAAALLVNAATGGNYGFLAHKPPQASMLDLFSDTPWLYVIEIVAMAFVFFPLLYVPWLIWDRASRQKGAPTRPA